MGSGQTGQRSTEVALQQHLLALRKRLHASQAILRADYEARTNITAMLRGRADLVDQILREVWQYLTMPAALALIATGGYGRGELYPASDIDLLLLLPDDAGCQYNEHISRMISALWDIGLEVGHSVRSIAECAVEAKRDITVQTNLVEARLLAGNPEAFAEFTTTMCARFDPQAFFKAKRLEQANRHAHYNDTPFSLEPNCKESPGGLRDLQIILWISRACGLGKSWGDLARNGLASTAEAAQLERCERFLRHIRVRLHYLTKRREDRLLFDHQEAVAEHLSIQRNAARRASERLMQRYYRNAKLIAQLNTILLQNLGERLFEDNHKAVLLINANFQTRRDLLDVRHEDIFDHQPQALLQGFLILAQRPELKGMTARTLRALWRNRHRIDARFRRDPANRALFIALLEQRRGSEDELSRMNQYDILGRYLPAFGRIVGQMQHDLFHVYTVDQHILQVVRNVRRFAIPKFAHEYPLCSRLMANFERPWLLSVAALFHDIAKGRGGDHSRLGVTDAKRFCKAHALDDEDTELIAFLVLEHLTMSTVAQKQDLADPEVITRFAQVVTNTRRLAALYLLTVADIRGTSPKVWNNWKGKLLEDLYHATQRLLTVATPRHAFDVTGRQEEARGNLRFHGLRPGIESTLWQQLGSVYFMRHDAEEIAWHTRILYYRTDADAPVVKARLNQIGEGLQVMVYVTDQPQLFARLCGFFSRLGYSIADAKIHTTHNDYALDSFILLGPSHQLPYRDMAALIEHDLVEHLKHRPTLEDPIKARLSRRLRHFPITPELTLRADEKSQQYVMSIVAADRPGLLYSIALMLSRHDIRLHTAKIATLGERAEDTFLISGAKLAQSATRERIEQELLEILRV